MRWPAISNKDIEKRCLKWRCPPAVYPCETAGAGRGGQNVALSFRAAEIACAAAIGAVIDAHLQARHLCVQMQIEAV